eukprot:TRINITY_DN11805_c0_g1_i4.p1 TRINITY_DN11805_c0_g1~~TRINITY_DN11805_c0_g1_i4.p1  ORF type:complete len:176 (+),score=24.38 TRINITY_DN11805_c0_g1_i4:32-529(+)
MFIKPVCELHPCDDGLTVLVPMIDECFSMEEAEALCTSIGILVSGRLRCYGTVQHLVDAYGTGYTLEIMLESKEQVDSFQSWLRSKLPSARLEEQFETRLVYDLPIRSAQVGSVFTLLEQQARMQGMHDYGLSQSTLEQVFLRFARMSVPANKPTTEGRVQLMDV